jgi:hypothetical protein
MPTYATHIGAGIKGSERIRLLGPEKRLKQEIRTGPEIVGDNACMMYVPQEG